jgi:hypothetical protein
MDEDEISAPKLRDTDPPRIFAAIRANNVEYNNDVAGFLIKQEIERRVQQNEKPLTPAELDQFRKDLISLLVIHGNAEAAINLRPTTTPTRQQLNG